MLVGRSDINELRRFLRGKRQIFWCSTCASTFNRTGEQHFGHLPTFPLRQCRGVDKIKAVESCYRYIGRCYGWNA